MLTSNVDELETVLLRLRLVDQSQLRECRALLPAGAEGSDLLETLERKGYLTSFQVQRLRSGEFEGLVLGNYKLLYRNASGSFARVYRACSVTDGQMVGIKVLRERWSNDPDTVQLFRREGEIGQRLKHKNIVPIYEVGASGRIHYITMEFVEGGNLRDFIKIRGRLEPAEACRYALHMTEALAYALGQGITHRDLKMTNVLLSSQGVAKLIDFGLAADDSVLKKVGEAGMAQALEYSTLEKHTGAPSNDPRSDLFFLGGILYELVSGAPPYPRTRNRDERRDISRYQNVRPISELAPKISPPVADIINKLMQIDPRQRYQTPVQLIGDLRTVIRTLDAGMNHSDSAIVLDDTVATVMCVDDRKKHQDWLREYLTRHGFRVLVLSDVERALARLESNPPDCLVLMGGAIGDRIVDDFQRAVRIGRKASIACVAVLAEQQQDLVSDMNGDAGTAQVLVQPIQLRDLRKAITFGLQQR